MRGVDPEEALQGIPEQERHVHRRREQDRIAFLEGGGGPPPAEEHPEAQALPVDSHSAGVLGSVRGAPRRAVAAIQPEEVARDPAEQVEGVPGVAGGQPGRVGVDPEGPLHPDLLDRPGCPPDPAGDEVERRAHLDRGRDAQLLEVLGEPEFPLGLPQGDHQEVGPGLADVGRSARSQPRPPARDFGARAGGPGDPIRPG